MVGNPLYVTEENHPPPVVMDSDLSTINSIDRRLLTNVNLVMQTMELPTTS